MSLNPFSTVNDYSSMLNKIGVSTAFLLFGATALLRWQIQSVDAFLKPISISVPIMSGLNVPLGTILPALLIGLACRVIKLHDLVSDILRIRHCFDVEYVLLPFALQPFGAQAK